MSKKTTAAVAAAAPSPALEQIIDRAGALARHRERLALLVGALKKGIEALEADALPEIHAAIDTATEAWKALEGDIQAHPDLFVQPRSLEAHGIRFGFRKGAGGLVIDDPDRTVELIERHFPDQADVLRSIRKKPVKEALLQLSAAELKKVAATIEGTGDVPFIRPAETALDKMVKAVVKAKVGGE